MIRSASVARMKSVAPGIAVCLAIAVPAWLLGRLVPVMGGAVFGIVLGMAIAIVWKDHGRFASGIAWTSKIVLQTAVVLLGFGMDLAVIARTGRQSLPIIVCTISVSLALSWALHRLMRIPGNVSTLVGVGSSICGGSAIAATAPVIDADDDEVAQAISVIFFYNVLAAILFPVFGRLIGFDTTSGGAFGLFAGTAVNDTSSVTAAASTWDGMWNLGSQTLDTAVTVKLTRTLAIIPITLVLGMVQARSSRRQGGGEAQGFSLKRAFPMFILYFILAAVITTIALHAGVNASVFAPLKELSKFLIVMAMAAIGLNSNIVTLVKTGGKPLALGGICWIGITVVSLLMQRALGLW